MNPFVKRCLFVFALLLLILIATTMMFVALGSGNTATNIRLMLSSITGYVRSSPEPDTVKQRFTLPEGFALSLYARDLGAVRFMAVSSRGDLLVSRPRQGDILLLQKDSNGDGLPDEQRILLQGLYKPHGIALHEGWLYIAESNAVGKVAFDVEKGELLGEYQQILTGISGSGNHWTKSLGIGPDGWLFLSSGSTCNVCEESDPQRAAMMRMKTDGSELEIYATGLRNSVGFDWAPWNQSLYATDNGRDLLGDNFPPCELNRIVKGGFYGWPFINGNGHLDPDLGQGREHLLRDAISPAHTFRAHNAPLGIRFLRHNQSVGFDKTALVALHGSWNRSEPDGYKVVALKWQEDGSIEEQDFLTGFQKGGDIIGRPVDVVETLDGTIFVSDDYSGSIYRISYGATEANYGRGKQVSAGIDDAKPRQAISAEEALKQYSSSQLYALRQQGAQLFRQYRCGNCHDSARATPFRTIKPIKQLSQRYSLEQLADFFVTPTPPMPVYPLNVEQREALAVYLYDR